MGYGDNLMATGFARGAAARGKRIAFGDGQKIIWDHNSKTIFAGNPNIAIEGSENDPDIEWVRFYRGHRIYNTQAGSRWVWNYDFRPVPGEMYFTRQELAYAERMPKGYVLIEPNVPGWKSVAKNKRWSIDRYASVALNLKRAGYQVMQPYYEGASQIHSAVPVKTPSFRHALAAMSRAALYIGPEGGLHHGAAAVGIPAVVIFGGFIPPQVTGYDTHTNLTGGAKACGSITPCHHCKAALDAISPAQVLEAALRHLKNG